jgi:hypothetical protein
LAGGLEKVADGTSGCRVCSEHRKGCWGGRRGCQQVTVQVMVAGCDAPLAEGCCCARLHLQQAVATAATQSSTALPDMQPKTKSSAHTVLYCLCQFLA